MTTFGLREREIAIVLLLGVVLVWGGTFALVKNALADAPPLLFNALRFLLASLVLLAVNYRELRKVSSKSLRGGAIAGALLAAGYALQTAGLARTSAIHAAFITGLLVIFVPLLSFVPWLRGPSANLPGWPVLLSAVGAFTGLFLITVPPRVALKATISSVGVGDLLVLGCAVAFAGHLLSLSRLSQLPASHLALLQIGFCSLFLLLFLPLGGMPSLHITLRLSLALAVTSVAATAGAFSVQTWAQQHLPPTTTALILTLEPVSALSFSLIFLHERLTLRSAAGSLLILCSIILTELLSPTKPATFEAA